MFFNLLHNEIIPWEINDIFKEHVFLRKLKVIPIFEEKINTYIFLEHIKECLIGFYPKFINKKSLIIAELTLLLLLQAC